MLAQTEPRNHGTARALASTVACRIASILLGVFMAIAPAAAWVAPSTQSSEELLIQPPKVLKERCTREIALFDRYGASRTENSDGPRNHTRIGAEIDCQKGNYVDGILAIENLLLRKKF